MSRVTEGDPNTSTGRLGRDALVYGISFIAARAASFIMLPIYTRYLTPADYGILHLLQMSLEVAAILLSAGVTAGVQRYYFKGTDPKHRAAVIAGSFVMLLLFNALGSLGLYLYAPEIAASVLDDAGHAVLVNIAATSFILDATFTVPMLLFQVQQRSVLYAVISVVRLVVQLSLNIVFVVVLREGVRGIVVSTLITYVGGALVLVPWMFKSVGFGWNNSLSWGLLKFGLPYRITEAGTFVMTYVDRFFLKEERGLDATGIYSLAYQFGFLLMYLGPAPFHLAWDPQRFQLAGQSREERNATYRKGYLFFSVLLVTVAVGICLYVRPVLRIMSDPAFHWAADVVPLIIVAFLCQAWGHVEEFGMQVAEKTHYTTIATWISVGVIVVLYIVLIPPYGVWGAAIATIVSYAVRWFFFHVFSERLFPVPYGQGRALLLTLLGAAVVGAYLLIRSDGLVIDVAVATALCGVYFGLLWGVFLRPVERQALVHTARALRNRLR